MNDKKPVILIDFDKAIYKDGQGFEQISFYKLKAPRIKKRALYLLETIKESYDVYLFSKKHLLEAMFWVIRNKLDKNCVKIITVTKRRSTYFLDKI